VKKIKHEATMGNGGAQVKSQCGTKQSCLKHSYKPKRPWGPGVRSKTPPGSFPSPSSARRTATEYSRVLFLEGTVEIVSRDPLIIRRRRESRLLIPTVPQCNSERFPHLPEKREVQVSDLQPSFFAWRKLAIKSHAVERQRKKWF